MISDEVMKGQKLFVRRVVEKDEEALTRFYDHEDVGARPQCSSGFLGKLVGDTIAHVSTRDEDDARMIESIFVAARLRRKQVGRVIISEIEEASRAEGFRRLIVSQSCSEGAFFERIGFQKREGRWERDVHRGN